MAIVEILKSTLRTREYVEKGEQDGKTLLEAMTDGDTDGMQHFDGEIEKTYPRRHRGARYGTRLCYKSWEPAAAARRHGECFKIRVATHSYNLAKTHQSQLFPIYPSLICRRPPAVHHECLKRG